MTAYKYDTHVHTSEVSYCGKVPAEEAVRLYKDAGYDGIVITDHFFDLYFEALGDISWNEKIDCYLEGYRTACEAGKAIGLKVLLGMEIRFPENINDYLVFGIDEEFLRKNRELYRLGLRKFRALTKDKGIMIFQAHPFRSGMVLAPPELLDGIEVYNGNPRHDSRNDMAYGYAQKNGLLMSSGSDFHHTVDLARGGIITSERINDSRDLVDVIRNDKIIRLIREI